MSKPTASPFNPHGIDPTPRLLTVPEKAGTVKDVFAASKGWATDLQQQVNVVRASQHQMSCDMLEMKKTFEAELAALEERTNEAINDTRRQYTKRCLTLSATSLPKRNPGEKPFNLLADYAKKEHGLVIDPNDIGAVHRNPNGSLIASFINTHETSAFFLLKNPHRNPHHPKKGDRKGVRPDFLMALTDADHEVRKALAFLREKDAQKDKNPATWRVWRVNSSMGGRVGYTLYPTNELFTMESMADVRKMMTKEESLEWSAKNDAFHHGREKAREERKTKRLESFRSRRDQKMQERKAGRVKSSNKAPLGMKRNAPLTAPPTATATSGASGSGEAMES